ncbi:MAG: MFS transporter, partial [Planctomycetes bacterium]|nr:MFS transporter [Planctomycetota bacterium]
MSDAKPGFAEQIKSYPSTFWVANTMEIFERMAWYGFYAVSSLYITGPKETGGLGFTSVERGQIQAIVPFFLYVFPVLTGALADRYGYKRMFIIAYVGMIIFYYLLGQATTMPAFLAAFMLVAVAAAIFKPVVVGTIARVTNERNSSTGFGIFYMMVNIGGFLGPLVAGAVRGVSWNYVFIACSLWAAVNLLLVFIFYKEPTTESGSKGARTFRKVLDDAVEALGNVRFFVTVFAVLVALMLPGFRFPWFTWTTCGIFIGCWIVLNLFWDLALPKGSGLPVSMGGERRNPLLKRMHCSNWRFALFLLILSGFWTSFNQIFLTMPEYIRDYTDTRNMVSLGRRVFGALGRPEWIDKLAAIDEAELLSEVDRLLRAAKGLPSMAAPEPETSGKVLERARSAKARLQALEADDEAPESRRSEAGVLLTELKTRNLKAFAAEVEKNAETKDWTALWHGSLRAWADLAESFLEAVDREKRGARLPRDPSLTDADRAELASLASQLNAPDTSTPIEALDLVDSARTILRYKVRIQPVELGQLLLQVPQKPAEIAPELMERAVRSVNRRLKDSAKPEIEKDSEAAKLLRASLASLVSETSWPGPEAVQDACAKLSTDERKIDPKILALGVRDIAYRPAIWKRMDEGRQVNPEHIVNFDAGAIVLL